MINKLITYKVFKIFVIFSESVKVYLTNKLVPTKFEICQTIQKKKNLHITSVIILFKDYNT